MPCSRQRPRSSPWPVALPDVARIKRKRRLLDGICAEVAEIFKDKHIAMHTFAELKKMVPLGQIEAAELMVATHCSDHPAASDHDHPATSLGPW